MKLKDVKLFKLNEEDQVGDTIKKFVFKNQIPIISNSDFDNVCGTATNIRVSNDILLADLNIDCRKIKKKDLRTAAPVIKDIESDIVCTERIVNSCELIAVTLCELQTIKELNNNIHKPNNSLNSQNG